MNYGDCYVTMSEAFCACALWPSIANTDVNSNTNKKLKFSCEGQIHHLKECDHVITAIRSLFGKRTRHCHAHRLTNSLESYAMETDGKPQDRRKF